MDNQYIINPLSLHAILIFSFFLITFRFGKTSFRFVSFDFVSFRLDRFRFVSFDFVSFRSVSFRFVRFRFVSFLFRFALYRYPFLIGLNRIFSTLPQSEYTSSEVYSGLCLFLSIVYSVFQRCPTRDQRRDFISSRPIKFSCNNVAPVTNLCLGRATTRFHSSQWSKKKLQLKHKSSLFTLQTFHYNCY